MSETEKLPEEPETTQQTAAERPTPEPEETSIRAGGHRRLVWWIVLAVLAVASCGAYAFWWHRQGAQDAAPPAASETKSNASSTQATFFTTPKQLNQDLAFFKDPASYFGNICTGPNETNCVPQITAKDIAYYQIGATASKQPIIVAFDTVRTDNEWSYIAIEDQPNHYQILAKLDGTLSRLTDITQVYNQQYVADFKAALSSNVSLDTDATIPALATFPTQLQVHGMTLKLAFTDSPPGYFLPNGLKSIRGTWYGDQTTSTAESVGTANGKTFYEVTASDQPNYAVKEFYAAVNQVYAAAYIPVDPMQSDTKPANITWTSGDKNQSEYYSAAAGCGSADGYIVAKNVTPSDLTAIGTSPDGRTLYAFSDSAPLLQELYNNDYTSSKSYLQDTNLQNLTLAQFQNAHAVVVAKNAQGEYVVYQRSDLFMRGGCGKPVVYLYPTLPTVVNVQVGADVVKSNPAYGATGWQNVLALPTGKLLYQGKSYDSLYWEGYGQGIYPLITEGTVVPSTQAVATIRAQMAEQGFKTSEINDFLAFWQPKLPKTPYVRLTWLTTSQMNHLAPLDISPQPTTLIRTFLDFEGLQKPEHLAPQTFTAPARNGFTVVEWGGLLRDGSLTRP